MSSAATATPPARPPRSAADRDLTFGFRLSVVVHLALVFLFVVKNTLFPGKPLIYIPSLRVDLVGLPDQLKNERVTPSLSPEITEALKRAEQEAKSIKPVVPKTKADAPKDIAEKDEMVLKPKHAAKADDDKRDKRMKSALARIKALSKISEHEESAPPKQVLIKGNAISKGTSTSGEARETAEANYLDLVRDKLQDNWALPVWLARQRFSAQVQIFIREDGNVAKIRFIKPSGNAQFDDAVKATIKDSQPFAKPTRDIVGTLLVNGILVGFPL